MSSGKLGPIPRLTFRSLKELALHERLNYGRALKLQQIEANASDGNVLLENEAELHQKKSKQRKKKFFIRG